jgi:hypothetical protein
MQRKLPRLPEVQSCCTQRIAFYKILYQSHTSLDLSAGYTIKDMVNDLVI